MYMPKQYDPNEPLPDWSLEPMNEGSEGNEAGGAADGNDVAPLDAEQVKAEISEVAGTGSPLPEDAEKIAALNTILKGEGVATQEEDWQTNPDRGAVAAANDAFEGATPAGVERGHDADPALTQARSEINRAVVAAGEDRELSEVFNIPNTPENQEVALMSRERAAVKNKEGAEAVKPPSEFNEALRYLQLPDDKFGADRNRGLSQNSTIGELEDGLTFRELVNYDNRKKIWLGGVTGGAASIIAGMGTIAVSGAGTAGALIGGGIILGGGAGFLALGALGYGAKSLYDGYRSRKARKALRIDQ